MQKSGEKLRKLCEGNTNANNARGSNLSVGFIEFLPGLECIDEEDEIQ